MREGRARGEPDDAANNSMDASAKQRLYHHVVWFLSVCVLPVLRRVISTVRLLVVKNAAII
ncbi:MAG: hypothetical protein M3367_07370 [Acidobacteriota bacterium]|nr:hypothetical protein [Acidobacteriota bacterium]